MADIRISDEKLDDIAAAAVVAAMGPEEREALIAKALKDLMQKKDRGYGFNRTSPLHEAFTRAMTKHAEKIAEKAIQDDAELTEKVESMVKEAIERVVVRDREETVKLVAAGVRDALFNIKEGR